MAYCVIYSYKEIDKIGGMTPLLPWDNAPERYYRPNSTLLYIFFKKVKNIRLQMIDYNLLVFSSLTSNLKL